MQSWQGQGSEINRFSKTEVVKIDSDFENTEKSV